MPPIVLIPAHNGSTTGASYWFSPTNAHGSHPNTNVTQWKVTVTTAGSNGGSLITETNFVGPPISACLVSNLPQNNNYYYTQIVYRTSNGEFVSSSNKFQSRP